MPYSAPLHNAYRTRKNKLDNQKAYNKTKRVRQDFYVSPAWRNLRNWYAKANPLCVKCRAQNRAVGLDVVDHIIPIKDGGERLSGDNLQGLCHYHHNQKTAAERAAGQGGRILCKAHAK